MCRRRDSEAVHSHTRFQACSRFRGSATAVKLAAAVDKFVIEGGVPLSGTIVPAGNKNAALPLLTRFGSAVMPPPGGDVIGRRRLDPHLDAFRALGATVEHGRDIHITASEGGLQPVDFFMDEPSVMATENALMAAALIDGTTTI